MIDCHLSAIEAKFAKILWDHVPLSTRKLVALGEQEFGWKRTTTYTVLKNLCQKGLFQLEDREVTALISRQQFKALKSHKFIEENFADSLPAMVVAFEQSKKLSHEEIDELQEIIDKMRGNSRTVFQRPEYVSDSRHSDWYCAASAAFTEFGI